MLNIKIIFYTILYLFDYLIILLSNYLSELCIIFVSALFKFYFIIEFFVEKLMYYCDLFDAKHHIYVQICDDIIHHTETGLVYNIEYFINYIIFMSQVLFIVIITI